jgi:hypothetical protein
MYDTRGGSRFAGYLLLIIQSTQSKVVACRLPVERQALAMRRRGARVARELTFGRQIGERRTVYVRLVDGRTGRTDIFDGRRPKEDRTVA